MQNIEPQEQATQGGISSARVDRISNLLGAVQGLAAIALMTGQLEPKPALILAFGAAVANSWLTGKGIPDVAVVVASLEASSGRQVAAEMEQRRGDRRPGTRQGEDN